MNETDVLLDDLQEWRRPDLAEDRPPPLIVEVFLDMTQLGHDQALVITDDSDRRWNVSEALASSNDSRYLPLSGTKRHLEVTLERWTVQLNDAVGHTASELSDLLPNVYKKGVVLFRSIYTFLRLTPAWKLHKKLERQPGNYQGIKMKFRIRQQRRSAFGQKDSLYTPLSPPEHESSGKVSRESFRPLATPVGFLSIDVDYRMNCNFGVASTEALISDQFLGADEKMLASRGGRSLPGQRPEPQRARYSSTAAPTTTTTRDRPRGLLGAYGSLGTFHAPDKRGSPISALKQLAQDDDDDGSDQMTKMEAVPRSAGASRRTSVNYLENPPFKGGSLATSPRRSPLLGTSAGRTESALARYGSAQASSSSKRSSLNALPQQHLRAPSISSDIAVASPSSGASSPKPAPARYSSSFANRTRRIPSQSSRTGESNTSSGRGSSESKEKSGRLNEGTAGSSGSAKTDEDEIASFISDLSRAKDVKFHTPRSSRDNIVNLAKYSSLRDPSTQLAEEMSSSSLIQTSLTPPSRRLSNVPGLSTSSSPSRTLAYAPHVRSRLSTHSIAEEASAALGEGSDSPNIREEIEEEEDDEPFIFPQDNL